MSNHKKIRKRTRVLVIMILFLIIYFFRPTYTGNMKGENSVNKIVNITIGGVKQSLLIRGSNVNHPLVLFLHGGPGFSQISFAKKYQTKLEKEFVVVNWDQRGSGKSYSFFMDKKDMTKDRIVEDAKEVIQYLCKEYHKEKIIIVGHSWGSELGMTLVKERVPNIGAYVGIGQVISQLEGNRVSYEYALNLAREHKNEDEIKELEAIGYPPYADKDAISNTLIKEKIIEKYSPRGVDVNVTKDVILGCLFSTEYNGLDALKFLIGNRLSAQTLWGTNQDYDLLNDVKNVDIPVYFCAGRYDYITPSVFVEEFYDQLKAPYKEFIWFEESSHFPHFNEIDKFYDVMMRVKEKFSLK